MKLDRDRVDREGKVQMMTLKELRFVGVPLGKIFTTDFIAHFHVRVFFCEVFFGYALAASLYICQIFYKKIWQFVERFTKDVYFIFRR